MPMQSKNEETNFAFFLKKTGKSKEFSFVNKAIFGQPACGWHGNVESLTHSLNIKIFAKKKQLLNVSAL